MVRRIPVADNVVNYAVNLVNSTRPGMDSSTDYVRQYLDWGAGPRASQYLILGAKAHAAVNGKFSPDIEDVKAVAYGILRHRIIKNYKAEAEGYSIERIIQENFSDKIESMVIETIEKAVSKEIERLKNILLDDGSDEDV